ncbi:MAG: hypothetical protein GY696_09910, partial [Gammaproteobacteria bacterium]|nr:hypothetical protein [Gammaproteobacteria bacterium]
MKTEAVWCSRNSRRDPPTQQATYDGTPIDWVDHVKILGVRIDCQLNFKQQGEAVVKSFSSKIRLLKNLRFMPQGPLIQFYNSVILPQVLYGIIVWGSTLQTIWAKIERRHAQAARLIYGQPWDTHGPTALVTAGWLPLKQHYKEQLLKLAYSAAYRISEPVIL